MIPVLISSAITRLRRHPARHLAGPTGLLAWLTTSETNLQQAKKLRRSALSAGRALPPHRRVSHGLPHPGWRVSTSGEVWCIHSNKTGMGRRGMGKGDSSFAQGTTVASAAFSRQLAERHFRLDLKQSDPGSLLKGFIFGTHHLLHH